MSSSRLGRSLSKRKNPHAHKNRIGTSPPPFKKKPRTPRVFLEKEPKNPRRPHKIGAAIAGLGIAGRKITDVRIFLNKDCVVLALLQPPKPRRIKMPQK